MGRINIKHKMYQVICPVSGYKVFVRKLTLAEQNILATPVTSYVEKMNLLLNIVYDAIQNKDVYYSKLSEEEKKNLDDSMKYDLFLKQLYWDDLIAILMGMLVLMNGEDDSFTILSMCTNRLKDDTVCDTEKKCKFKISRMISDIKVNETQEDVYSYTEIKELPEYGVKVRLEVPNLYKELFILDYIEKLNNEDILKKYQISKYHKDIYVTLLSLLGSVTMIQEIDNPENKIEFVFSKDGLDEAIEFVKILADFDDVDVITDSLDITKKYYIELTGKCKCPKCGYVDKVSLKEAVVNYFFPELS